MKKLLSLAVVFALLLSPFASAESGDLTPEQAMEKLKAKQEARRLAQAAATQSASTTELADARAANAELKSENAALKATIDRLKAEILMKDRQIAAASKKDGGSASSAKQPANSIFDVDSEPKK